MFVTGVTSSWQNSSQSRVHHLCPAERLGGQMTEFAPGRGREVIRRFRDDPADP